MCEIIRIKNINSSVDISFCSEDVTKRLEFLTVVAKKTPVYLVNEETMDELYPPEKRVSLNEECIQKFFDDWNYPPKDFQPEEDFEELEKISEFEKFIEECKKKVVEKTFVAVGVYSKYHPPYIDDTPVKSPAIFICPERCIRWGVELDIIPSFVFEKVYFHELAHAFMDEGKFTYYDEWWSKVIEESLANAIAISKFPETYRENVIRIILSQPIEYRGSILLADPLMEYLFRVKKIYKTFIGLTSIVHIVNRILCMWKMLKRGYREYIHINNRLRRYYPSIIDSFTVFKLLAMDLLKYAVTGR